MADLVSFNDHEFSHVGINFHTHLGPVVMKSLKLLVLVIMDPYKKNGIININEKSNDNTNELGSFTTRSFKTLLYFIDVNTKKGRGKGTTLPNHDITFNIFRPPFIGLKLGNVSLVEVDHNNPQFKRNHDLFKPLLELISRDNVENFSKVYKTTEEINFTNVTFLYDDPKGEKVVYGRVMSPKYSFPFSSFTLVLKPKANFSFSRMGQ